VPPVKVRHWTRDRIARGAAPIALGLALAVNASAQDLQSKLDAKRGALAESKDREGVLTSELGAYEKRIVRLTGQVALLRNREALVAGQLRQIETDLASELERLHELRGRFARSRRALAARLVEIYKTDQPDALTVLLDSQGFDDLVTRYDFLSAVQDQDAAIVERVRALRDQSVDSATRIRAARAAAIAKQSELARTRVQLEISEMELQRASERKAAALDRVEANVERLEGSIGDLSERIEQQLRAEASTTADDPIPAGPVQPADNGFIWPVDGVLTSPFGLRWGRLHAGIDIAAPGGTPIRAAKAGTVTLAEPYGGYGNYTCVDHGAGLSSCYAHQSGFATTEGADVSQGDVIGYVGNTGASFGDHLHFEVRLDGTPVDPLGYLG
jgi:murein DD-endopeptidase MepM/ murein hydrolase activator NlpD